MAKLIRFPEETETWLTALAERERRTFTAQLLLIVDEWREWRKAREKEQGRDA